LLVGHEIEIERSGVPDLLEVAETSPPVVDTWYVADTLSG
jgi:hypothetical protein